MAEQSDRLARSLLRQALQDIKERKSAGGGSFLMLYGVNSRLLDSHTIKALRGFLTEAGYRTRVERATHNIVVEWD